MGSVKFKFTFTYGHSPTTAAHVVGSYQLSTLFFILYEAVLKPAKLPERDTTAKLVLALCLSSFLEQSYKLITSCAQVLYDSYLGPGNFFTSVPIKYLALFQLTNY